ncbi:MAG: response regulator [Deltaproteobacteria bacterium]|nr:response regulator [Deltaproteobacteria bacterium]
MENIEKMNNPKTAYNILVIDDDPLVLEDASLMYKDMIFLGDFNDIFGVKAVGSVSTAKNTKDAESVLQANFEKDPKLVQLLHVDERMPEERGSEFVDRIRRIYTLQNIGALLVTGYAADVSVLNSREKGVYRYVSKPVTPALIKPHLKDLVEMIKLKDRPNKRTVDDVFLFKMIETEDELLELLQLRFLVWEKLGYIPDEFRSEGIKLEIDDYDKYSVHVGGFLLKNGFKELVTSARVITLDLQHETISRFNNVLKYYADDKLRRGFEREVEAPLPIYFNYDPNDFLSQFPEGVKYGEYSRLLNNPDFRGINLAPRITQMVHFLAKVKLGLRIGFAECLVRHVPMNLERLGFSGIITGTNIRNVDRVEQIANAIYVDLNGFDNPQTDRFHVEFNHISENASKNDFFCYCPKEDCIRNGFLYENTSECPRNSFHF